MIDTNPASPTYHQVIETSRTSTPTAPRCFDEPVGIAFASNTKAYVALSSRNDIAIVDAVNYAGHRPHPRHGPGPAGDRGARRPALRGGLRVRQQERDVLLRGPRRRRPDRQPVQRGPDRPARLRHQPEPAGRRQEHRDRPGRARPRPVRLQHHDGRTGAGGERRRHAALRRSRSTAPVRCSSPRPTRATRTNGDHGLSLPDLDNRMFLDQIATTTCTAGGCGARDPLQPPPGAAQPTRAGLGALDALRHRGERRTTSTWW